MTRLVFKILEEVGKISMSGFTETEHEVLEEDSGTLPMSLWTDRSEHCHVHEGAVNNVS